MAVALEPAGPRADAGPPTGPAGEQPRAGQPCQVVDRYPVSFTRDGGAWVASFAFAGGATHGHLRVPAIDAHMIAEHDAYVSDVRLGSYEPPGSQRSGMVCRVDPTYHFYCPEKGGVDRFCLTWVGDRH